MKTAVLDIDGCLASFGQPFHTLLTKAGATLKPWQEPEMWDWFKPYGATDAQIAAAWQMADQSWWERLPMHADMNYRAIEDAFELYNNFETTFVTARPRGMREGTINWLKHRSLMVERPQVLHTSHDKVMALVAIQPDLIIEDRPHTLIDYAAAEKSMRLPPCLKILVARPYNARWQGHGDIVTAINTGDALRTALKHLESL